MTTMHRALLPTFAALLSAGTLAAQTSIAAAVTDPTEPVAATEEAVKPAAEIEGRASLFREVTMQYFTPQDQRGLNTFEAPKTAGVPFTGFRLDWGAAFTQQFQSLDHSNAADPMTVPRPTGTGTYNANELMNIGTGFNNAAANLYLNAQLAPGIRVSLTTYLSSRHHPEAWVKDGFLLIDESPIAYRPLQDLMKYVTVRAGHFEINYGDAHFRRTDNGNALHNPFVGNYIMDAFTTEVGAEVYVRANGLMAMGAITGGEIKGNVLNPDARAPTFLGKLGFDRQLSPDLRVRLTGSAYTTEKSLNNTLYGGDRAGSRYYFVMENTVATEAAQFTSGLLNPGFRSKVTAFQLNPFVKFGGLELFGVAEQASGRAASETADRTWTQFAGDAIYRFLAHEQVYVGARYNTVRGDILNTAGNTDLGSYEAGADRYQIGGGWFITPNILLKGEYVNQTYTGFPSNNRLHGGKFNGFMIEGVVAF